MSDQEPTTELQPVPFKESSLPELTSERDRKDIPPGRMLQRFTEMTIGMSQVVDPLMGKLDAKHLTAVIANVDKADERRLEQAKLQGKNQLVALSVVLAAVLILCGLFLGFGKSEQLDKILALIIGLIGGFGIGRVSKKPE